MCRSGGERHPDLVLLREQAQDDGIEPSQLPAVALCDVGYQLDVLHASLPDSPQIGADYLQGRKTYWTDASTNVTDDPHARVAAWAIVTDCLTTDLVRSAMMEHTWSNHRQLPNTFQVVQVGFVPGAQTNNRGELYPICRLFEAGARGTIWTDSQYVANLVEAVQATPHAPLFRRFRNFDLISKLCAAIVEKDPDLQVCKVKAHKDLLACEDDLSRYVHYGNHLADAAANRQREALPEEWAQLLSQYRQQVQVSWQRAKVFCNLHATAFQHSAQDGAFTKPTLDATQPPTDEFANRLAGAQPPGPFQTWSLESLDETAHKPLCFFGWGLMRMLSVWAATLQWPSQASEHDPGISFLELYIHFIVSTGHRIPKNTGTPKRPHYVLYHDHPGAKAVPRPYNVEILDWIFCVDIYKRLMDRPLFPLATSSEVPSMRYFWGTKKLAGVVVRPYLPDYEPFLEQMQYFRCDTRTKHRPGLHRIPDIPCLPGVQRVDFEGDTTENLQRAKTAWMKRCSRLIRLKKKEAAL